MMQRLRLAELMAALSLATDLGMGQPLEQALRTCLIAIELAERMGLAKDEISEVFYVALLRFLGCTADAEAEAGARPGSPRLPPVKVPRARSVPSGPSAC